MSILSGFNIIIPDTGLCTVSYVSSVSTDFRWDITRTGDATNTVIATGNQIGGNSFSFQVTRHQADTYTVTCFSRVYSTSVCLDPPYDMNNPNNTGVYYPSCNLWDSYYDNGDGGFVFNTSKMTLNYTNGTPSIGCGISAQNTSGSNNALFSATNAIYRSGAYLASQSGTNTVFTNQTEGSYNMTTYFTAGIVTQSQSDDFTLVGCVLLNPVYTPTSPTTGSSTDGSVFVNWTSNGVYYNVELYKNSTMVSNIANVHSQSSGYRFSNLLAGTYTVVIYAVNNPTSCRVTSPALALVSNTRYYLTGTNGSNTYYASCPIPLPTISVDYTTHLLSATWLPEGAENGNTTDYDFQVVATSIATNQTTTLLDSNTYGSREIHFYVTTGISYAIRVRANCKDSGNNINTSAWSTVNYTIPYYYHGSAVGLDYLEICPMVDLSLGVDTNNTLFIWFYFAGHQTNAYSSGSGSNYNISVFNAPTGGTRIFNTTISSAPYGTNCTVPNLVNGTTYRVEVITMCDSNTNSTIRSQTITPFAFTGTATQGTVQNPSPQITLNAGIPGVKVVQTVGTSSTNIIITGTSTIVPATNGTTSFVATDPNNPNNTKTILVSAVSCPLTANSLTVTPTHPNTVGATGSVTATIPATSVSKKYILTAPGFTTTSLDAFDNTYTATSLAPNTYTLRVELSNSPTCFLVGTFTIYSCDMSIARVDVVNPTVFGGTGTATVFQTNPQGQSLVMEWSVLKSGATAMVWQTTNVFNNLTAGSYTAYVRYNVSGAGTFCQATLGFTITQPSACQLPSQPVLQITHSPAYGTNGSVTSDLSAYSGTIVYRVRDANSTLLVEWLSTPQFSVAPGSYFYDVNITNIQGCTRSIPFTINPPTCNLNTSAFNVSTTSRSYTANDGTITISPTVTAIGTFVYTIVRQSGGFTFTYTSTGTNYGHTFTGLGDGAYTLTLNYNNTTCQTVVNAVVGVSAATCNLSSTSLTTSLVTTNCSSFGANDGSVTMTKNNFDTTGYTLTYYVRQGTTTVNATVNTATTNVVRVSPLPAGNYEFVISYTEQPSCLRVLPFTITQPLQCNIANSGNVTVSVATTAYGQSTGSATVNITTLITGGATVEYRYASSLAALANVQWQTANQFPNLAVGTYYYEVRYPDYVYCSYTGTDKTFTIAHVCPTVNLVVDASNNGTDIVFSWTNITPAPLYYVLDVKRNGITIFTGQQNTSTYTVAAAQKNIDHTINVSPRYTNCAPTSVTSNAYQITANSSCPVPGAMSVAIDPTNSALSRISWGAATGAVKYLFSFKKATDAGFGIEIETFNSYYSMSLDKGTPYSLQVRTNCVVAVQGTTNNSGMTTLNYTKFLCPVPTNVTTVEQAGGLVLVSATLPGMSLYASVRKITDAYPAQDTFYAATSFTFTAETNASYEIRVRSVCDSNEDPTSVYALTTFTRSCPVVQANTITYIPSADAQSLVISWSSTETTFRCRYKVKTDGDETYSAWQNITQRTFTFAPVPNKVYTFQLVTMCGTAPSADVTADVVLYRCDLITGLSAGYDQSKSNTAVTWVGKPSAYGYHYQYWKYSTPTAKTEADTAGGASSFTFVPSPNKRYRIGVKSLCNGNGANTNESGYISIDYTYDTCPLIQTITTVEATDGTTTVSWAASTTVQSYNYNYSTDDGSDSTSSQTTDPYFVFEPVLNKNYTIEVAAICDEVTTPFKSVSYMKSYCPLPIGNITTTENGNITNVQWAAVTDAEGYQFRFKKKIDVTYTTRTGLVNSTTFTPQQGVEYVLGVRAICSQAGNIYSNWLILDSYIKALPGVSRWTGTLYSKTTGDNTTLPNLVNNQVQGVYISGDDVWVATAHDSTALNDGIWHLNATTKATEQFGTVSGVQSGRQLPNNDVRSIWQSAESLWAGTPNGLWRKDINPQHTLGANPVQSLSCLVNGRQRMYVLNKDSGHLFVVDPTTDTLLGYIVVPKASYRMRFLKDAGDAVDKLFIQNEKSETITVVETVTGLLETPIKNEGGLVIKNSNAYILNFIDNTVSVLDATTNTQLSVYPVVYRPISHSIADNGNIVVVSRVSQKMSIINGSTGATTTVDIGSGSDRPEQVVCLGNTAYVRTSGSASIMVVDVTSGAVSSIGVNGIPNYLKVFTTGLLVLTASSLAVIQNGGVAFRQPGTDFMFATIGSDGNAYIAHNKPHISTFNLSTNAYVDNAFTVSEDAYNVFYALNKAYIVTEKNGVNRLTVWDTLTNRVLRVLALTGRVVDMNFVGNKFIYMNIENSKNISVIDAEISAPTDINIDSIAINYPVRNTFYSGSKYYVLHRSGEKVIIVNTDNHYLDGFAYLANNGEYLDKLDKTGFRYIGGVDNMASIWMNGLMRGSVWHGGTWSRGMFTHRELAPQANDFFDSPTTAATTNYQNGIWLRGMWLSGYFSQYNDRANLTSPDYYKENGTRSIFMGLKAGNAFNKDSIFGLSSIDLDNIKTDILENPATNDHSYSSLFARRMNKMASVTTNKPYFSVFNGKFVNGILFDDDKPDTSNRPLASIYSSFGAYFFNKQYYLEPNPESRGEMVMSIADGSTAVAAGMETTIKQGKNAVFTAPDNWQPLFYYYGQAKITSTRFLKEFYNFGQTLANNNGMWRHNHTVYGDGTVFPSNGTVYANLPFGVSVAQGAASKWNTNDPAGEPRYGGTSGTNQ